MAASPAPLALHVPEVLAPTGRDEGVRQLLSRFQGFRSQLVAALRSSPALVQVAASFNRDALFAIKWPEGALEALRKGEATWKRYADGSMDVVLRGPKGNQIVKHLRLREVNLPVEAATALNNLAVQAALAEIVGRLEELDAKVERVLAGQRADRYGTIDGGIHLYEQAMAVQAGSNRDQLLNNALQSLADGRARLLAVIQQEAREIVPPTTGDAFWKSHFASPTEKHAKRLNALADDAAKSIVATRAMVVIHEERGDTEAARVAVSQLADVARECAPGLARAARAVPRRRDGVEPEHTWKLLERRILPAAHESIRLIEQREHLPLVVDVTQRELVGTGVSDG